jgi:hypothetical protein
MGNTGVELIVASETVNGSCKSFPPVFVTEGGVRGVAYYQGH